jgi:hypothetical protein
VPEGSLSPDEPQCLPLIHQTPPSRGVNTERGITPQAYTSHDAVHTNVYIRELTARLEAAAENGTVEEELLTIKLLLESGDFPH